MNARARNPRVVLERRSLRSLRRGASALRVAIALVAATGVVATTRFAVAPPAPRVTIVRPRPQYDAGGAWAAEQLARGYLTWGPAGADAGVLQPASANSDSVSWVEVAETHAAGRGVTDYVVAAETSLHGLVYLDLVLETRASGRYALARYPAFVAAPSLTSTAGDLDGSGLPAVTDTQLERVLERALDHYLDADRVDLAADLAAGSVVSPPTLRLALRRIERLAAEPSGAVLATLVATDTEGNAFTLTYRVGLALAGGRWELTSINPDPSSQPGSQT